MASVKHFAVGTLSTLALGALSAPQAHAEFVETFTQVGTSVVATGSGTINLEGLTSHGVFSGEFDTTDNGIVIGQVALFATGASSSSDAAFYSGASGPGAFSKQSYATPETSSGDPMIFQGNVGFIGLSPDYVSGSALSNTMSFANTTLASLGIGTYTYTWSSDSLVVKIGEVSAVPLPAALPLLGTAAAALAGIGFTKSRRNRLA